MPLRFIKKYGEILINGALLACWLWRVQLSAAFSGFGAKDWISVTNTLATLFLSIVAICGINSWRREYKEKQKTEATIDFAERGFLALDALRHITNPLITISPNPDAANEELEIANATRKAIVEKINENSQHFNDLSARRYRYRLLIAPEAEKICLDLISAVNRVGWAIDDLVRLTGYVIDMSRHKNDDMIVNGMSIGAEVKQNIESNYNKIEKLKESIYSNPNSEIRLSIEEIKKRIEAILQKTTVN